MGVITLRGINVEMKKILQEKAKKKRTSVNRIILNILEESLGFSKKRRNAMYDDLDHLAGTWTEEEFREFDHRIAAFESVDEKMWK